MVNGEDTSDVPGSEEHTNALDVLPTSLTEAIPDGHSIIPSRDEEHDDGASSSTESVAEAIPDPKVTQAGEGIVAEPANVGDGQAPAQLNLTVGGLAAAVASAPAVDAANVGGVAIAAAPHGNPVAQIQDGVGVIANAAGPFVGAHNADAVPAGVVGPHNAVIGGAPPRADHANGVAHAGGAAIAHAPFGAGGNPVALAQAGAGLIANGAPAGQAPVLPNFDLVAGLSGPPLRRSEVGPFF